MNTTPIFQRIVNSPAKLLILQGGTSCFAGNQKVITSNGSKEISTIAKGDLVKTKSGLKRVTDTLVFKNTKPTVRIRLKNGHQIICTDDHEFYYNGGWYKVKDLLSLLDGRD